jgi:flagellar protein FliT
MPPSYPAHTSSSTLSVLRQYEVIEGISSRMLNEALSSRWDAVAELGTQYQAAVETLKGLPTLTHEEKDARRTLLAKILDNDTRIRHLISPELERLNGLMGTLRRQQKVLNTYSSPILNQ